MHYNVIDICEIEQADLNKFLIAIKLDNGRNVESTKPVDYMKIYIEIFSITLMRKKHHLLDPVYQKPYIYTACESLLYGYTS